MDLRVDCLLLFACCLLAAGLLPALVGAFLAALFSLDVPAPLGLWDGALLFSGAPAASSPDASPDLAFLLELRLLIFFTAGVLVFLAGALFLMGVALGGGGGGASFFTAFVFLAVRMAEDVAFLAGDRLARAGALD